MLTTTRIHRICTLAISACLAFPAIAAADTVTFDQVGATGWTVPANVSRVSITVAGASGGHDGAIGSSCTPGRGGEVTADLALNPGGKLQIFVGERGGDGSGSFAGKGGAGGGGAGGGVFFSGTTAAGGGGGGESFVKGPTIASPNVATAFVAEAGGGGGCGGFADSSGGNGGTFGPGGNGLSGSGGAGGGAAGAGTGAAGGANEPADANHGGAGKPGVGGNGFGSSAFAAGGGGGGGGVVGGGGGGAAAANDGSGGGGGAGGSEFTGNSTFSYNVGTAHSTGDGSVTITYTPAPAPAVVTESVSDVTDTAATITAGVNPAGIVGQYHVEYGPTTSYGQSTSDRSTSGTDAQSVSEQLSELVPGTVYHYRVVATNASGTTDGPDQTFRTPGAPSVTSGGSSDVGETAATLSGTVNPNGRPTSYHFELGTTTAYGLQTAETSAGADVTDQHVTAAIAGLAPDTLYHYRLVATNASGTTHGSDEILKTGAPAAHVGTAMPHNIQVPAPRAQLPVLTVVGRPMVANGSVRAILQCRFAPCRATAALTANVGRHIQQTIGSSRAVIRAGARATILISLNAMGRRLLATHRRITAQVVLSLASGSGSSRIAGRAAITLGR